MYVMTEHRLFKLMARVKEVGPYSEEFTIFSDPHSATRNVAPVRVNLQCRWQPMGLGCSCTAHAINSEMLEDHTDNLCVLFMCCRLRTFIELLLC